MRLAILGATSHIAKDLVQSFAAQGQHELVLYARRPDVVSQWLHNVGLVGRYAVADFAAFSADEHFDAILNFVGVGNPAQAAAMGATIFDVTLKYDELALNYLRQHPECRYLFLSSGAAYGSSFESPANVDTKSVIDINQLQAQEWYGVAKLHAECRHRALPHLPIIDLRVFSYFSRTQDMSARFFLTDVMRAIRNKSLLKTSPEPIVRDFLHPSDFHRLVHAVLTADAENAAVDCYTLAPIGKSDLLAAMQENFGLLYEVTDELVSINATGNKPHYYSLNTRASDFGYQPSLTSLQGVVKEMHEHQ